MREVVLSLLLTLSIAPLAIATEPSVSKTKKNAKPNALKLTSPQQKAQISEDPGSATRLLYEDPRNKYSLTSGAEKTVDGGVVKSTCTDNMGMIYKKGDAGYDGCLRTVDAHAPPLPGENKRPPSVGITIGR